jgi:hypothetical protein
MARKPEIRRNIGTINNNAVFVLLRGILILLFMVLVLN